MFDQDSRPSSDEIVSQYWPYDGPHSTETVESAAAVVAGLVRYMSNATWNPKRLPGPGLYRVLSDLNSAVYGLDQLLRQLANGLSELANDATLYDDRRDRPAAITAGEIAGHLAAAWDALAGEPRKRIERAAQLASHLGHDAPKRGA